MVRAYTIAAGTVAVRMRDAIDPTFVGDRSDRRPFEGLPAVFVDRDGVINGNDRHVNSPDDFELLPGSATAIRRLNEARIPVIVVTNQGAVAFEYVTAKVVGDILDKMDRLLAEKGAFVDVVYAAFAHARGTVPALAIASEYRKPRAGMLEQARDDLGVDLGASTMVGDATTDILAGRRAGCRTILVQTGLSGEDGKAVAVPDLVAADLLAAVDLILAATRT
jgi:D-glycero-D-manno-heptose 1,7-bisphosphate phosphatase